MVQDVRAEYEKVVAQQEVGREKRKQQGPSWQCWVCRHKYPAEGFGADRQKTQEVYALCVEPGHWRCCVACQQAHAAYRANEHAAADTAELKCATCLTSRMTELFEDGATECNACILLSSFETNPCSKCGYYKRGTEVFNQVGFRPRGVLLLQVRSRAVSD